MADPRTVVLPCGVAVPVLGQGTWRMGEDPGRRAAGCRPCAPGWTWG
jgi:diketogulonate reductase-like aldo/keto reductase